MKEYIETVISLPINYIVVALIAVFYTLEHLGNSSSKAGSLDHLLNNILFYISVVALSYFFALVQVFFIQFISDHHIGLINHVQIPFLAKLIIGVVFFDFSAYWLHRLTHKSPLLWRIHLVHHSDTDMDASTFFRHHPLEVIVSGISSLVATAIFGLNTTIVGLYIFILIPLMILQHTNITFPKWIDKVLGTFLVTPNFHKLHHSQNQFYTDSNYADIFIIWDKLFGTYKSYDYSKIVYGLEEFNTKEKQDFWYLMRSPFVKAGK